MRKVLSDINDLIKEEPIKQEVSLEELKRSIEKREKAEYFRKKIYVYLKKYNKPMELLSREDLVIMTEGMNALDKELFMDQVKRCLETNRGKPIKWIVQNKKSLLFNNVYNGN